MRTAAGLVLGLALALAGCGSKKEPESKAATACEANEDCPDGLRCTGGKCVDWRSKAIYESPGTAVKPADVGREIERQQDLHDRQIDRAVQEAR